MQKVRVSAQTALASLAILCPMIDVHSMPAAKPHLFTDRVDKIFDVHFLDNITASFCNVFPILL